MDKKKIVAFCCENSSYKAAESIRTSSLMKAVEVVKLPCAGKVEIGQILKCLENGVERVLVLGCPIDNCKYITGNCRALKRVNAARQALKDAGIEEEKVRIELVSSLDTHKLIDILKGEMERL
ncbi:hypothetical protein ES703_89412 [subsurface metagenome]